MSSIVMICAVLLVASHLSCAVILRPKWYPYFRRDNQESGSGSGQSALPTETLARQIRTPDMERLSVCQNELVNEECLDKIVTAVIGKILQLNNQKYLLY